MGGLTAKFQNGDEVVYLGTRRYVNNIYSDGAIHLLRYGKPHSEYIVESYYVQKLVLLSNNPFDLQEIS